MTLPHDYPDAKILLLRSCIWHTKDSISWEADLLDSSPQLEEQLVRDILGARRNVLFIEGTQQSLDLPLYSLVFPNVSVIPKASCRDVEQIVTGIREVENLHWVRAFGIIDRDSRSQTDLERLRAKGIYPLEVFSIESIYYNLDIQRHIAERQAAVTGENPSERLQDAMQAALRAIEQHKKKLSERVAERSLREAVLRMIPGHKEVASGNPICLNLDVSAVVATELKQLETALTNSDLQTLISRYPIRETPALKEIATRLGFKNRQKYEAAVRKLLLDESKVLNFVRDLFGTLYSAVS